MRRCFCPEKALDEGRMWEGWRQGWGEEDWYELSGAWGREGRVGGRGLKVGGGGRGQGTGTERKEQSGKVRGRILRRG